MKNTSEILGAIVDRCYGHVANRRAPVVVFDLDATLFNNCPRTVAILSEFAEQQNEREMLLTLATMRNQQLPYRTTEVLEMAKARPAIFDAAIRFWQQRFFTDHYQHHDVPVDGAPQFAQRLFDLGATIVYLSGRDVPGMLVGCTQSLRQHGFPIGMTRTLLLLKPNFEMGDTEFKVSALDFINSLGPVVAAFDNEPGNCNLFFERWPDAISVCMDTHCAPGAPALLDGVVSIAHFS